LTEEEKVKKIIEGDDDVLKDMYLDQFDKIRSLALRYGKDESSVFDLFQDGMIDMIENLRSGKFDHGASLGTYLFSICRNKLNNEKRKRKIETSELNENLEQHDEEYSEETHKAEQIMNQELGRMKEDCKKLLRMFYFEKKPLKEIASIMSYTESFVRVKSNRCKNTLRKKLAEIPYIKEKYGYDIR